MISIRNYSLEKDETERFHVKSYEVIACPICGGVVAVIGSRERYVIVEDGDKQTLVIRRLRCNDCRTIHHELPDIIVPYKRHCSDTIEKIVAGDADGVNCENGTIHRIKAWWTACLLYFKSILTSLKAKYEVEFSEEPAPKEIVRAVANAHLWIHTRSEFLPS